MKKFMLLIFICAATASYADTVDRKMQAVFQELSEKYIKKHPLRNVKKGSLFLILLKNQTRQKKPE